MKFNNNYSIVGFIPHEALLDEVIAQDTRELEEIDGSFEDIAIRMQKFLDFAESVEIPYEEWEKVIGSVTNQLNAQYGRDWSKNSNVWKAFEKEWVRLRSKFPQTWYDNKTAVLDYLSTRGFQLCPFEGCKTNAWNEDVRICNRETERELVINQGTVHLARVHHLLEKGNEYGISAREFYEHFMPED